VGILDVIRDFERSFRANNKSAVKANSSLPPARVREAIRTGVFVGGGKDYPCENEAREATSVLLNRIDAQYRDVAGGPTPWDNEVLTGGGPVMLYDRLVPLLDHQNILLADEDRNKIHLANVRGGLKLWRLLESEGALQ
jgi:hypothetical protein